MYFDGKPNRTRRPVFGNLITRHRYRICANTRLAILLYCTFIHAYLYYRLDEQRQQCNISHFIVIIDWGGGYLEKEKNVHREPGKRIFIIVSIYLPRRYTRGGARRRSFPFAGRSFRRLRRVLLLPLRGHVSPRL